MISVTHIQLLTSQTKHTKGNAELFHTYFGSGYLCKDKLVFKSSDAEDLDKEADKEETDNDGSQNLNVGYSLAPDGYALCDSWWDVTEAAKNGNKRIRLAADITQTSCFWYGGGDTYTFDGAGHTIYVRFSSHGDPAINGSFIVRGGNLYIRNTIFDFGNSYDAPCGIVLDAHTQNRYCKAQNITMRNAKATFNGSAHFFRN